MSSSSDGRAADRKGEDFGFPFPVDAEDGRTLLYLQLLHGRMMRLGKEFSMPEGYCVKCKAKKEIMDAVEEVMKNGRRAIKGKCPTCGTVMFKILGGKASATAAAPATTPANPSKPAASN